MLQVPPMDIVFQILFAGLALLGTALLVVFVIEFREDSAPHPNYRAEMKTAERGQRYP
ncbi:MAG: hypothetical protein LAP21_00825 [Acidobacteriia bacterium]|nr:hypothetical protein [Terriglobia bacterium]